MDKPIGDDEIRILGNNDKPKRSKKRQMAIVYIAFVLAAIALALNIINIINRNSTQKEADMRRTASEATSQIEPPAIDDTPAIVHTTATVDSVELHIYRPVATTAELCLGRPDTSDATILMALQAADLRRDNGRIVGAFVLHGEPLSWGLSKRGYCGIIDGKIILGVADNSPLFEQATEVGGDFFRQYPAVDNGQPVENNPENSSLRRALCSIGGQVCIVCSDGRLTMNAFSRALARYGVSDAIFLVGSTADGWVRTDSGLQHLGIPNAKSPKYLNYILFRAQ